MKLTDTGEVVSPVAIMLNVLKEIVLVAKGADWGKTLICCTLKFADRESG